MQYDAQPRHRRRKLHPLQVSAPDIEAWLLEREPVTIGAFNSIGAEEYARSFTAAQTAGADIINDLYFAMVDVISQQGTEQDFAKLVVPILKQKGWLGGDHGQIASRVALIYDTNLRLARASGRWQDYQASKAALPYVLGVTVGDERVRHPPKSPHSDHRAFDGILLPLDHPFVAKYWTPFGFRCRCLWQQLSRSQFARRGGKITSDAELEERALRLGPPVFASPTAPISTQLAAITTASNDLEKRMPGLPLTDPVKTQRQGHDIWDAVLAANTHEEVGRNLARFGFR